MKLKNALNKMRNGKPIGHENLSIEVFKKLRSAGMRFTAKPAMEYYKRLFPMSGEKISPSQSSKEMVTGSNVVTTGLFLNL